MRPIEVSAKIPVAGYTPGQMINLELHVKHKGSEKLYEFTVHLMKVCTKITAYQSKQAISFNGFFLFFSQRIDYYAKDTNILSCCSTGVHNMESKSVASKDANCRISNTSTAEIVRINIRVPPVPPTDYSSSNVVKVTYFLCVCMETM